MAPSSPSRIFQAFRALGYVTSDVPFCIQSRGTENYIVTSVGLAFHIYDLSKLHLKFVSSLCPSDIVCLTASNSFVFAATTGHIHQFERSKMIRTIIVSSRVHSMMTFGASLICIDDDNFMKIYDLETMELFSEINFTNHFFATTIAHPTTYLNKVILGSQQGSMQLWNIRTRFKKT